MTFFKAYGKRQALLGIKCWENSFGWTKYFISFHMSILKNVFFKTKRIQVYVSKKKSYLVLQQGIMSLKNPDDP